MDARKKAAIIIVVILFFVRMQFVHPIFKGDVLLDIPKRVRSTFEQLFHNDENKKKEEKDKKNKQENTSESLREQLDPDKTYDLEEGDDTPMQVFGDDALVDLPDSEDGVGGNGATTEKPGKQDLDENELPMDEMGGQ